MSATAPPLAGLRFSLIGPGAVGQSLAAWIRERGGRLEQIGARPGSPRAAACAARLGVPAVALETFSTAGDDLLLLAVPDAALAEVAARIGQREQASVALHVSGFAPAEAIAALRSARTAIGGFHPLRAFPAVEPALADAAGMFFALDGDPAAVALGKRLAAAFGGRAELVSGPLRPLYHLVATLMAGALTTVAATASEIARRAGLPEAAREGYARLATDALATALARPDPASGITGPAARGDRETLFSELDRLREVAPEAVSVVRALARESLRQRARYSPPEAAQRRLAEELDRAELLDRAKDGVLTSTPKPPG